MPGLANGGWRNWLLGVTATVIGSMVINGIVFQRETRKEIAENGVKIVQLQQRDDNIIKFFSERMDERLLSAHNELVQRDLTIQRLEKRIDELERRVR